MASYSLLVAQNIDRAQIKHFSRGAFVKKIDDNNYSYAYGPPGLHGLIQNPYTLGCAIFASLGGLTFGYDQGVIANLLVMSDFKRQFPTTPFQQGTLTAVLELGALCGALTSGFLGDRIPRQRAIAIASVVFCIGSIIQTLSSDLFRLGFGRAIGGVGIGGLSMLSPLYMSEISPPEIRGSLLSIEQFSIVLGVVLGFWLGFVTRTISGSLSWRLPLAFQLIPGIVLATGSFLLPHSPRFLVSKGKIEDAQNALEKLRMVSSNDLHDLAQIELLEMRVEASLSEDIRLRSSARSKDRQISLWSQLFSSQYQRQTWLGITIMFFQQWSGINAVLFYGPSMMRSMGMEGDTIMLVSSGFVNILQFLAVIPAIIFIDRLGRKPLLMFGSSLMTFSHACIAVLVWYGEDDWATHRIAAWTAVSMIYLFTAGYGLSFGPVSWVLPNEIFPSSLRSRGVGLATASNWINNFFVGLITPSLIFASPAGTYVLFSLCCIAAFLWSWLIVPETRGRSLEEMDELFGSAVGHEEAERKREIEETVGLIRFVNNVVNSS